MLVGSASTSTSQRLSWRHELSAQARWRCASSSTPQPTKQPLLPRPSLWQRNSQPRKGEGVGIRRTSDGLFNSPRHRRATPAEESGLGGWEIFRLGRAPRHGRVELPSHDAGSKPSVDLRDPLVMALRRKVPRPPASCMHAVSCCPFAHVQDCHSLDISKSRSSAQVR